MARLLALVTASLVLAACGEASRPNDPVSATDTSLEPGGDESDGDADVVTEGDPVVVGDGDGDAAGDPSGDAMGDPLSGRLVDRCWTHVKPEGRDLIDYEQFELTVPAHCMGTAHQDIEGVEQVVFLGDSVTVGTPPTAANDVYRADLSRRLAARFGLEAPNALWNQPDPFSGHSLLKESGDFKSCSRYGARTDDLPQQLDECFPDGERSKRTLIVMTMGGNDVSALTQDFAHATWEEGRAEAVEWVRYLREALVWLTTPGRFPNGVFVVFSNNYEFTDATKDMSSCPAAALAGTFDPWDHPEWLEEHIVWVAEQYMAVAVETGTDIIFMLEEFCGHGYHHEDAASICYRGPSTPLWFDETCVHPNAAGHDHIADMFMAVVDP
jgi:lysophospholipase L1-like esterase